MVMSEINCNNKQPSEQEKLGPMLTNTSHGSCSTTSPSNLINSSSLVFPWLFVNSTIPITNPDIVKVSELIPEPSMDAPRVIL